MLHHKVLPLGLLLLAMFCGVASVASAAEVAGTVLAVTPGAFVERAGERTPLAVKDAIHVGDTLLTDATGRVRIWLQDETSLSLGSNTNFVVEAFAPAGDKPRFSGSMTGLARLLTGKIAKANPDGVVVNTPLASVGIRGTICTIQASHEHTIVQVESTLREVLVNGAVVKSSQRALVRTAGGKPEITQMSLEDRQTSRQLLSVDRRPQRTRGSAPIGQVGIRAMAPVTTAPMYPAKDVVSSIDEALMPGPVRPVLPMQGTMTGILEASGGDVYLEPTKSGFSFDVDLQSGRVSNASLWGQGNKVKQGPGHDFSFGLKGGSGTVNGGAFTVNNGLSGTHTDTTPNGSTTVNVTGNMEGAVRRTGTNGLDLTRGTFDYNGGGVRQSGTLHGGGTLR